MTPKRELSASQAESKGSVSVKVSSSSGASIEDHRSSQDASSKGSQHASSSSGSPYQSSSQRSSPSSSEPSPSPPTSTRAGTDYAETLKDKQTQRTSKDLPGTDQSTSTVMTRLSNPVTEKSPIDTQSAQLALQGSRISQLTLQQEKYVSRISELEMQIAEVRTTAANRLQEYEAATMAQSKLESKIKSLESLLEDEKRKQRNTDELVFNIVGLEARVKTLEGDLEAEKLRRMTAEDESRTTLQKLRVSEVPNEARKKDGDLDAHLDWLGALELLKPILQFVDNDNNDDDTNSTTLEDHRNDIACYEDLHRLHAYIKKISNRHTDAVLERRLQVCAEDETIPTPRKRRRVGEAS